VTLLSLHHPPNAVSDPLQLSLASNPPRGTGRADLLLELFEQTRQGRLANRVRDLIEEFLLLETRDLRSGAGQRL
jgi:hypothetical protein